MNPLDLPVSNATNGWADIRLVPDLSTLRRVPWEPNAALVVCDVYQANADEFLPVAPRSILRSQVERADRCGLRFKFASELEFFLSTTPPRQAWELGYQNLKMLSDYRSDYQMVQSGRDDWFIEQIRNQMFSASPVHSSSSIGPMMSPQILMLPAIYPKRSIDFSSTDTSLATGFPRFVMMSDFRCCATSSIRRRQLALKSAAATYLFSIVFYPQVICS